MTTTNFSLRQSVQCWQCNAKHSRSCSGTKSEVTHSVILNLWLKFTDVHWLVPFIYPITTPHSCKSHKLELNVSTVCIYRNDHWYSKPKAKALRMVNSTTSSKPKPSKPTAKNKTCSSHSFRSASLQQGQQNNEVSCFHISDRSCFNKKTNSYCVLLVNLPHPVLTRHKMQWTLGCCTSKDAPIDIQKSQ